MQSFFQVLAMALVTVTAILVLRKRTGEFALVLALLCIGALCLFAVTMLQPVMDMLERLESLNRDLGATILMVTHDAFTASYCRRILFIKDGRLFTELNRGSDGRRVFFERILEVVTLLGGDAGDVL